MYIAELSKTIVSQSLCTVPDFFYYMFCNVYIIQAQAMCCSKFDLKTIGQEIALHPFRLFEFVEIEYNIDFLLGF